LTSRARSMTPSSEGALVLIVTGWCESRMCQQG
jgi:hypothetical protein